MVDCRMERFIILEEHFGLTDLTQQNGFIQQNNFTHQYKTVHTPILHICIYWGKLLWIITGVIMLRTANGEILVKLSVQYPADEF